MARKKVTRALAPLPSRRELEKAHHKTEALTNILRNVPVNNQQEQPRASYSVSDAAPHFADAGIRLLGVANDTYCPVPCRYQVRRDSAIRTLLSQWKAAVTDAEQQPGFQKAERVILVQAKDQRSAAIDETLHAILDDL